jgi:hypothetical protein
LPGKQRNIELAKLKKPKKQRKESSGNHKRRVKSLSIGLPGAGNPLCTEGGDGSFLNPTFLKGD